MNGKGSEKYKRLLVKKHQELLAANTSAGALIPAAGCVEGDLVEQANADAEAELEIQLHRSEGGFCEPLKMH